MEKGNTKVVWVNVIPVIIELDRTWWSDWLDHHLDSFYNVNPMKFKSLGWVSIGYQVMVHTATTRPSSSPHSYVLSWISVSMSMTRSKNELVACIGIELAILKIEIWNKYRTSIFSYSNLNKKTIIIKDIWSSLKSWWFVLGALFSLNGEWWLRFVVEVRSLNGKYFSR